VKRPGFLQGVLLAAALGVVASVMGTVLTPLFGLPAVVRMLIPALGLAYVLYLLARTDERTGRVTALALWATMAVMSWWLAPSLPFYLAIHAGAIWLLRSLYFYAGFVPALCDLGLSVASIALTVWAAMHSGSLFLATWCFFLVQALFVAIPRDIRGRERAVAPHNENFDRARRQAEAALQQLFDR
jgi:hypothetical protein